MTAGEAERQVKTIACSQGRRIEEVMQRLPELNGRQPDKHEVGCAFAAVKAAATIMATSPEGLEPVQSAAVFKLLRGALEDLAA